MSSKLSKSSIKLQHFRVLIVDEIVYYTKKISFSRYLNNANRCDIIFFFFYRIFKDKE